MKNAQLITLANITVYSPGVLMQTVKRIGDPQTTCPVDLIEFGLGLALPPSSFIQF